MTVLSSACYATLAGLRDEPLEEGTSRPFAADYEAVVSAAREAVQQLGLSLGEDYPVNDSTWVIFCEVPFHHLGYVLFRTSGAVVRVVVQSLGERQTVVRVISRARDASILEKGDYSQDIFAALIEKLEGKLHFFAADYEAVASASREAVQELGFQLAEDYPDNDSTWVILCEGYGQFLRVVVEGLGETQTAVRVISRRHDPTDLIQMEDYSQDIFATLIEKLERQPHIFAADYEAVVSAAREAVQEAGLALRVDYPVNDSTWVILCEGYGQFLRVVVQRLGEKQTAVRVIFRRGEAVELRRMEDYSQDIFGALIEKLEGEPQRP